MRPQTDGSGYVTDWEGGSGAVFAQLPPSGVAVVSGSGWRVTGSAPTRVLAGPNNPGYAFEVAAQPLPGSADTGGDAGPAAVQTATATVTTDPDTFVVSHDFDLGGPTVAAVEFTLTASDADGETWDDTIAVDIEGLLHSADGITWKSINNAGGIGLYGDTPGGPGTFSFAALTTTPRYLRINNVRIIDPNAFDVYAGANNPTATVRIDVAYL